MKWIGGRLSNGLETCRLSNGLEVGYDMDWR